MNGEYLDDSDKIWNLLYKLAKQDKLKIFEE
jgi:hypothetical protein